MENFIYKIQPSKIEGEVKISGAKNSSLRLLAASILTNARVKLTNNPNKLLDVLLHIEMLESLGKTVKIENEILTISEGSDGLISHLDWDKRSIRNTILIAGALLARTGKAIVPLPGGCKLGDACKFLHTQSSYSKTNCARYLKKNYKIYPCRYYNQVGGCRINKCHFLHESYPSVLGCEY